MTLDLGDKVRDKITGFEGVVTGHCRYISGCDQLLLAPRAKDGDLKESHWVDSDRCELVEAGAVRLESVSSPKRPGADRAAPKR